LGGNLKTHVDGDVGWVEGVGVLFGNESQRDLDRQYFTPDTDYGHAKGNMSDATLNHGIPMITGNTKSDEVPHPRAAARKRFKNPITTETIDTGILARHALDLKDSYEKWVFEETEKGTFKWSSGALGHLLDADEKTGEIKRWIIGEFAYTPTPAEPRLAAITPLKSYQTGFMSDEIKATETNQETTEKTAEVVDVVTVMVEDADEVKTHYKGETMTEEKEVKEVAAPLSLDDIAAVVTKAVQPLQAELDAIKAKPVQDIGIAADEAATKKVNVIDASHQGSDPYGTAFKAWIRSKGQKQVKALEIGVDAEGGFLVPEDWESAISSTRSSVSFTGKLPVQTRTTDRLLYNWPAESIGAAMVVTAEEAAYDQTDPVYSNILFTMAKYTRLVLVSEELLSDEDAGLQSSLTARFGREAGLAENAILITRLGAATTGNVGFASATVIAQAEIPEMVYTVADGYELNGWVMRKSTEGQIRGISGTDFQFVPSPAGNVAGMLWGAPVATMSAANAQTTGLESVYCGDFTQVGIVRNRGFSVSVNPYLYEGTGQVGFFARTRFDIQVLQGSALVSGTQA
jgi:HK97 family phage major capsid protein